MVAAMLETSVFLQKQIARCNSLAEQAANESDREFWLRLAHRWGAVLQAKTARRSAPKSSDLSGELPSRLASGGDQESAPLPRLGATVP